MTRKVILNVAVTISTNEENVYVGTMENIAASHTKNCLLDNPDIEVFTIEDVDVVVKGSEDVNNDEVIQETIMNLNADQITELMHRLGIWDENTILADYSPEEVGRLVNRGNELGFDVDLEVERGRDYYLFAREVPQNNYFSTYKITGHIDTFEEIGGLLDIWGVVGNITHNDESMQTFKDFMKRIQEK